MFQASQDTSQIDLCSNIERFLHGRDPVKPNDPNAWHNVFLDQVTRRIDEARFRDLLDEESGHPNAPIPCSLGMTKTPPAATRRRTIFPPPVAGKSLAHTW